MKAASNESTKAPSIYNQEPSFSQFIRAYDHGWGDGIQEGIRKEKVLKEQAFKGNIHTLGDLMLDFCQNTEKMVDEVYALSKDHNFFEVLVRVTEDSLAGENFSILYDKENEVNSKLRESGIFVSLSYVETSENLIEKSISSDGYKSLIKKSHE